MNFKRAFLIISLLCAALVMASSVSAVANVDYFNNTTEITFEDMKFMIPAGFGESKNAEDFDDLGSDGKTCFYINEAHGEIIITVISDWMGMTLDEMHHDGAHKTKINGHKGWKYKENNLTCFGYVHDDKGVIVAVTNDTRLSEVIIEK